MGIVTCVVDVLDDTPGHAAISGATIRVFDGVGAVFITAGVTDALGSFSFDVNGSAGGTTYQLRISKIGVGFTNPQMALVYDPLPPATANHFLCYGTVFVLPVATDVLFCRCSGFFIDAGGRPLNDLMIRFVNKFDPIIVGSRAVLGTVEIRTDATGYAVVDLIRGGDYTAQVSGLQDENLRILVPDQTSINLIDLLFPVVSSITFDPAGPWVLAAGASLVLTPTVTTSSLVVLDGTANGDVAYAAADQAVATVEYGEDTITIVGVRAGSTTLELTRRDDSIIRSPNPGITGSGTAITVT